MATHSSTLAWEIPWTEELGRLQSMGSRRVRHNWVTSLWLFTFTHWRRKWQPTPVFLPGESQGREPGGLPSMGSHRVGHDWSDLAAAARLWTWLTHDGTCPHLILSCPRTLAYMASTCQAVTPATWTNFFWSGPSPLDHNPEDTQILAPFFLQWFLLVLILDHFPYQAFCIFLNY